MIKSKIYNYFLHLLAGIAIGWMMFGCAPIKRHQRLVKKYPFVHTQDTIIVRDTIREFIPKVQIDTIFHLDQLRDTIIIEKDRLKIKMFTIHDSIYIDGECDSIFIEKIIERKVPIRYYDSGKVNWWKWILIISGGLTILAFIFKRRKNEEASEN